MGETTNINQFVIEQYLQGKLDPKAMHALEKQALNDPFLADALEGYKHTSSTVGLSILQRQLEERIAQQQENKNVFNYSWQRLSIAAVGTLLFLLAGILFWMKVSRYQKPVLHTKHVEVFLTPEDSLITEPVNGWAAYENYLKANNRISDQTTSGTVVVEFLVNTEGKGENFYIIKGLNGKLNREAIRLIKEGPAFKPLKTPVKTQVTVKFNQ
jgi:hypothetical protein